MHEYLTILTAASAIKMNATRKWKGPGYAAVVDDDYRQQDYGRSPVHRGLAFRVTLVASNVNSAAEAAQQVAQQIADEIAFLHNGSIAEAQVELCIGISPNTEGTELLQIIRNSPSVYEPRRDFDHTSYKEFFAAFARYSSDSGKSARRIRRALHYLRRSLLAADPLDAFEDAWFAAEALNPLLAKVYSVASESTTCRQCKEQLVCAACQAEQKGSETVRALRKFSECTVGIPKKDFSRLVRKRRAVMHSLEPVKDLRRDLDELTAMAQQIVISGVRTLLRLDSHAGTPTLRSSGQPELIARAILREYDMGASQSEPLPQLVLKGIEIAVPTQPESHSGAHRPHVVQAGIDVKNYSGEWEIVHLSWLGGGAVGEHEILPLLFYKHTWKPPPDSDG